MTLMIYCTPEKKKGYMHSAHYRMFFDINNQDYIICDDTSIKLGEFRICAQSNISSNTINVDFSIFHNYENQLKIKSKNDVALEITNAIDYSMTNDHRIIFNDFLFNRTKAYYAQYPFHKDSPKWYHQGSLSYVIPEYKNPELKTKIYVAPCRTHRSRRKYRTQLVSFLKEKYLNLGYLGNHDNDPILNLRQHSDLPYINNIHDLEMHPALPRLEFKLKISQGMYDPPHNEYYRNTFISIYGETIEFGNTIVVTEKTYDPLIKGHFVLPFSTNGFIRHLENLGFQLPNFIDYSYDTICDDDARYQAYTLEIDRLMNMDLEMWRQLYKDNYSIIHHNQLIFHEKPYDRINFYNYL